MNVKHMVCAQIVRCVPAGLKVQSEAAGEFREEGDGSCMTVEHRCSKDRNDENTNSIRGIVCSSFHTSCHVLP